MGFEKHGGLIQMTSFFKSMVSKMLLVGCVVGLLGISASSYAVDSISVKNFRQIFESLRVITGVTPDAEVNQAYLEAKNRLPRYGRIDEISSPMLLAVTSLSGAFCKKMIATDAAITNAAQRRAHRQVVFTQGPVGLTEAIRRSVIQEYARLFWQRDAVDTEIQMLLEGMNMAIPATSTTVADTSKVLKVACTTVASSLESYIF